MAFVPLTGNFQYLELGCLGSASMVKGGLVRFDLGTGFVEPSGVTAIQLGVCMSATQTASATNGATKVIVALLESGQRWVVDTTGDVVATQVGTTVSLTDAVSIDEDDTGNTPIFNIVGYVGALTDRKAIVMPNSSLILGVGV